jgi:uncharacterized protein YceH (UPF0502 family)
METLDVVRDLIRALSDRPEPLVKQIAPAPGSRAERYLQLLAPESHVFEAAAPSASADAPAGAAGAAGAATLSARVDALEAELATLKEALRRLAASVGEADPLPSEASAT